MFRRGKIYDSIDTCPIGIFNKCINTGDYSSLVIKGNPKQRELVDAWNNIYKEYVDMAGIPESFKEYCKLKIKAGKYYSKSLKDKHFIVFYQKYNALAEEAVKTEQKADFDKVMEYCSKFMGFGINPMKVSVREFYGYLKLANNG